MALSYVAGKYVLLKKIASGGMAEVFLAKQIGIDGFEKLVVLKRILPHLSNQKEYVNMFLDEAKTAADLRHSNVVNTFEFGEDRGVYFMVMEFLHGQDVRSIYRKAISQKDKVPLGCAVGIIIDVCLGLSYAHSKKDLSGNDLGIVHRDISPQNIVVTYEGETKIVDFGIAKAAHQNVETSTGVLKGKYSYMSPEQALGQNADLRTDIFALGIVLYEMTTWQRLFKRDSDVRTIRAVISCAVQKPSSIDEDYPSDLQNIVLKALARNKENRYQSCDEFRADLERFLHARGISHSTSRLRTFMRNLFKEQIEKDKRLVELDSTESNVPLSWGYSEGRETESTRIYVAKKYSRVHLAVSILLGIGLAFVLIVLSAQDFEDYIFNKSSVSYYGGLKNSEQADVSAGLVQQTKEKAEKKISGRLKVVVEPWAEVYLDDSKIGSTPLSARLLPEGSYKIRLENPMMKKKVEKKVTILAGQDTLIRHVWK